MIINNNLNRLLVTAIFYLSALGLTGCSSYNKTRLGLLARQQPSEQTEPKLPMEKSQVQPQQESFIYEKTVDWAGNIGGVGMGVAGGMFGGATGAFGASISAAYEGTSIPEAIVEGAASGARLGASIAAPIGRSTARIATSGLIWGGSYAVKVTSWLYKNTKYVVSVMYNRWVEAPDISSYDIDNQESDTLSYIGDSLEPCTMLEQENNYFDDDSGCDSSDDIDTDQYFDANDPVDGKE